LISYWFQQPSSEKNVGRAPKLDMCHAQTVTAQKFESRLHGLKLMTYLGIFFSNP